MPLAAGLRNILNPSVVVQATEPHCIELWEKKRDVNMRVKVFGLPAVFIAIRTERHWPCIESQRRFLEADLRLPSCGRIWRSDSRCLC